MCPSTSRTHLYIGLQKNILELLQNLLDRENRLTQLFRTDLNRLQNNNHKNVIRVNRLSDVER